MKVRATEKCYIYDVKRRAGNVFDLEKESDFREKFMEWVEKPKKGRKPKAVKVDEVEELEEV